ncbi:MAG: methyltransferase [Planctomycetaceae bacterium]
MSRKPPYQRSASRPPARTLLAPERLEQRPLAQDPESPLADMVVRSPTWHAHLFKKRLGAYPAGTRHGDLVRLVTGDGQPLGIGYFNPRAEISVRVLSRVDEILDDAWWDRRLQQAVDLRRELLKLDGEATAYRVVHAEGDRLPGVVVDRYGDVLVAEVYSLGMQQRVVAILERLCRMLQVKHWIARPAPFTAEQEGFAADWRTSENAPRRVIVNEHGTEYEVDLDGGHKTGFFCDQRENRRRLVEWHRGGSLLDLCCYSGGFAVPVARRHPSVEVTAVDLDEQAIEVARRNAQRNRTKVLRARRRLRLHAGHAAKRPQVRHGDPGPSEADQRPGRTGGRRAQVLRLQSTGDATGCAGRAAAELQLFGTTVERGIRPHPVVRDARRPIHADPAKERRRRRPPDRR